MYVRNLPALLPYGGNITDHLRSLRKEPSSAAITSITLALGIGLCTVSFSLVYGVFLRGLDVPEPDRLALIYRSNPSQDIDFMSVTMHDLYDWREQQTSFEGPADLPVYCHSEGA